ncbi:hypothetical protein HDV01_006248 [Terramyces sp. JEL0728]|nr:hypothetical protein HDV01_006248 [Terramyces sp. JEL0728]
MQQIEKELQIDVNINPNSCIDIEAEISGYWEFGNHLYWVIDGRYFRQKVEYNDCDCYTAAPKELLLDINQFTQDSNYNAVGIFEVLNESVLAFSLDLTGSELFGLYIYNYTSHSTIYGPIPDTYYSARWFSGVSREWGVPLEIYRIHVGSLVIEKIYEEADPALTVEIVQTADQNYLFIKSSGQITSEYQRIAHSNGKYTLSSVISRVPGIYYDIEHNNGYFYCRSNIYNDNFSITKFPINQLSNQATVFASDHAFIEKMEMQRNYLLLWIRSDAVRKITIINLPNGRQRTMSFGLQPYSISPGLFVDIDSRIYRKFDHHCVLFSNSSFIQPAKLYVLNLESSIAKLVIDYAQNFDPSSFVQQQLTVPTLSIPISIVYKIDAGYQDYGFHPLKRPLFINAYGAYGGFQDPAFSNEIFPLLHRGYVWAICHPRGDGDLGRNWYLNGKYEKKRNTFLDVQRCIDYLVSTRIADPDCISLKGRSAGGLISGNAIISNFFSTKFESVIAHVPYIDPIYDMIDETVPWTSYERTEWGTPFNSTILDAMIEYSPYHNLRPHKFPAVYVSCGLEDSRVPYYEPLKFIAKLRNTKKSREKPIIIKIERGGHFMNNRGTVEYLAFVISNSKCGSLLY